MGGGNGSQSGVAIFLQGLSPRGRGKPLGAGAGKGRERSIPAWAGETLRWHGFISYEEVYPRVGGGNAIALPGDSVQAGLSPRGRGKRLMANRGSSCRGSIPAWAGETAGSCIRARPMKVYPRVGGGNPIQSYRELYLRGLSPRGRGKRHCASPLQLAHRSIPAWAGETLRMAALL